MYRRCTETNFTVDFWINLSQDHTVYQEIMRTNCFTVYYENSKFGLNLFNLSVPESEGYKTISSFASITNVWTHVAVTNLDTLYKSSIVINGNEAGSNTFIKPDEPITTWYISNDTDGFSGLFRELHLWKAHRSPGRIHADMHRWQLDYDGNNYRLLGYYPMNEGSGVTLRDHASTSPTNVGNYKNSKTTLISPYWVRSDNNPVICSYSQIYDESLNTCRLRKSILRADGTIELKVNTKLTYRDWSFHVWVKYKDNAEIEVDKLFQLVRSGQNFNYYLVKNGVKDTSPTTLTLTNGMEITDDKWYQLSLSYIWEKKVLKVDQYEASDYPSTGTNSFEDISDSNSEVMYHGEVIIKLTNGYFMHVSLWKKYLQRTQLKNDGSLSNEFKYIDPYSFI